MKDYLITILIAFDIFLGSFIPGAYEFETISSRAFREGWKAEKIIDKIFFWEEGHCESSYWSGLKKRSAYQVL
jgi:hypothetical protein